MGFIKGQQVLYMGPAVWVLADFVENDEGWPKLKFNDESEATVRPSNVRPLNARTCDIVLGEYDKAIDLEDFLGLQGIAKLAELVCDAVRYGEERLAELNEAAAKYGAPV
jgi:hypothetical protein